MNFPDMLKCMYSNPVISETAHQLHDFRISVELLKWPLNNPYRPWYLMELELGEIDCRILDKQGMGGKG